MVSDFNPQESYRFFLEEATELLQVLEDGLLNISTNNSLENIYNLMRTAHSLKGGSALVSLHEIEQIAHQLESIFKLFYESQASIDTEIENLLLEAYECLRTPLLSQINTGKSSGEKENAKIKELFTKIQTKQQKNTEDLEINNDHYDLFRDEIKQGLNRLKIILNNPYTPEIKDVFRAQINILHGLAEISEITALRTITNSTIQALENNSGSIIEIGHNTLKQLSELDNLLTNSKGNNVPKLTKKYSEKSSISTNNSMKKELSTKIEKINHELNSDANYKQPLPIGSRLDLVALDNISNLFNELIITDNKAFSSHFNQSQTIDSFKKWLLKIINIISNTDKKDLINLYFLHYKIQEYLLQIKEIFQDLELLNNNVLKEHEKKQKILKEINNELINARMLPIGNLLKQFPRLIKDLARKNNKQINLIIEGEDILIGKLVLEKLYNPLIHLLRNSVSHGIEEPDIRQQKGKNIQGSIQINVYRNNHKIIIEIVDDGQGIDINRIKDVILAKKLLSSQELEQKSKAQLYDYLFDYDFSTSETIDEFSGRGVGLSIVKQAIEALQGNIKIDLQEEIVGTRFILEIPLALSLTELLIFQLNGKNMAMAFNSIKSIISVTEEEIKKGIQGKEEYYEWKGKYIPIYPHESFFTYNYPNQNYKLKSTVNKNNNKNHFPLLLIKEQNYILALKIEGIITQKELIVKPLSTLVKYPTYLSSFTMLTNGEIVSVLDAQGLINHYRQVTENTTTYQEQIKSSPLAPSCTFFPSVKNPTILVVDDSLTIRQSLSLTLQKRGYTVVQAEDGWEALAYLKEYSEIKVVISDIEMPKMNGLEFLSYCRHSQYKMLPIIILTSRSSEKYRQLAIKLGANNYITKPYLDKDLLAVLKEYC